MMPEIRWTRVIRRSRSEVWDLFLDADAAKVWLGVVDYIMPKQEGGAFCWLFDPGGPKPTAFAGRLLAIDRPTRIEMLWELSSCAADTRLTWTFEEHGTGETLVVLTHDGFPDTGLGPFEHDGYAHHWGHILDGLEAYAHGSPRDTLRRHGAMIGLIPVGAVAGQGLLIKEIIHDTPAEKAELRPGDSIRTANGTKIQCFDDWDEWIDARQPGELVHLELADRNIDVVLGEWRR
jgi:uncharacterized protein YndB with AHSA1/START domain